MHASSASQRAWVSQSSNWTHLVFFDLCGVVASLLESGGVWQWGGLAVSDVGVKTHRARMLPFNVVGPNVDHIRV